MRAAFTPVYGPADVLELRDVPAPTPGDREVLIEVHASPVTAADLRLRTADFPSVSALPGRLMMGVRRPRNAVQGTMFSGRVVGVGRSVTRYAIGDEVFGSAMHGGYAEYLTVPEDTTMAKKPARLGHAEAAALPYGAITALCFLRDVAAVRPGERVLILGASGGVGRFAVQLAKHFGAEVTAVCRSRSFDAMRSLGADHVLDYRTSDFTTASERYDVIFDVAGVSSFSRARSSLTRHGRYMTLILSVGVLVQMLLTSLRKGPRAKFAITMGDRNDMEQIRDLVERGVLRAAVSARFPLERIADAHAAAEARSGDGTVVVVVRPLRVQPDAPCDELRA